MYRRIRDLREDYDLTQAQMANYLHCSRRIYSNYECGDVEIPTLPYVSDGIKCEYSKTSLAELNRGFKRKIIKIIKEKF